MAAGLTLVAGGESRAAEKRLLQRELGEPFRLPAPLQPTLSELFASSPRDGGWAGFLLPQLEAAKPLLWIQDRMAIRESGRVHPAGLPGIELIHVEARDGRDALWAMEEGLRCFGIGAVIGELYGDPVNLDFTATRRLAVAAERTQVPCWLVRLGGTANLSGARMRWRVGSMPSLPHPFDLKAPGTPAWEAELFRARGHAPGSWGIAHETDRFHLLAGTGDRALEPFRRRA
ncbi:ImuA family protein [Sphingomonas alba]|uniref:RecA-like protein n=1 Tax=Sphingomonas alba TaxID=2908208 RepID=A0ABT0RMS5_9SPHN|nr:recA-like protein [Sphingomonas alba]MCL6683952.1 recA-like protein [Sphingomonas alba]